MGSFASNPLCLECGLCCNGVIFADTQLQPGDDVERLRSLGLRLIATKEKTPRTAAQRRDPASHLAGSNPKFAQPCAAFDGRCCRIYDARPKYCRQFECLLLKSVKAAKLETADAVRIVREARRRADKIKQLLSALGDTDEHTALSVRFRRTSRRLETATLDDETAELFSQLTLAVQDLNVTLSEAFYPG